VRIYDFGPQPPAAETPVLFRNVALGAAPRPLAVLGSVVAHVLIVVLLTVVSNYLAWLHEDDVDWSQYRAEPLRLHLSEVIYFSATKASTAPAAPASTTRKGGRPSGMSPVRRAVIPPQLELPTPAEIASDGPAILQPDFRPDLTTLPRELPPLRFWARQEPNSLKHSVRSEVVVPGRKDPVTAAPKLAAPPTTTVPNRERIAADINVALPAGPTTSSLATFNSTTLPVRVRTEKVSEAGTFEMSAGQPINVLALAVDHRDLHDVEIPRGIRNIPRSGGVGRGNTSRGSVPAADTAGSTSNLGPNSSTDRLSETDMASGSPGLPRPRALPGENRGVSAAADSTEIPAYSGRPPEVIRIQHPPAGNFDVVVMQSGTRDDLTDVGGILTGNPVFTVYLGVGDQKEWLLEYCVPGGQQTQASPYQVNIDDPASVLAPYPVSTTITRTVLERHIPKQLVIHGLLTTNGTLKDMHVADPNNLLMVHLLAILREWQFRPALRNKLAIEVEVLLIIPSHS
jgi:hypothetical protein